MEMEMAETVINFSKSERGEKRLQSKVVWQPTG